LFLFVIFIRRDLRENMYREEKKTECVLFWT